MDAPEAPKTTTTLQSSFPSRKLIYLSCCTAFILCFIFLVPVRGNPYVPGFRQTLWDMIVGDIGATTLADGKSVIWAKQEFEEARALEKARKIAWEISEGSNFKVAVSQFGKVSEDDVQFHKETCESFLAELKENKLDSGKSIGIRVLNKKVWVDSTQIKAQPCVKCINRD